MRKSFFLLILMAFALQVVNAQNSGNRFTKDELLQRKEIYFSFQTTDRGLIKELNKFIILDKAKGTEERFFAYATQEGYQKFLDFGLQHQIEIPPSLRRPAKMTSSMRADYDWDAYPTYEAYVAMMEQFAADYPNLCSLYEIGSSVEGRRIIAARLHAPNYGGKRPNVLYTGQMHGDELVCYILQLRLIDHLLSNYGTDERITRLLDEEVIYINPLANPDGTYAGGNSTVNGASRTNANGVDLNRNFPDPITGPHPDGNDWQTETVAFMELANDIQFTLSANTHSGAEVVNYPWDSWNGYTADDAWWVDISRAYADAAQGNSPAGYFTDLNNGITHGYSWYSTHGSRQDYMNFFAACREATIEQSTVKLLPAELLPDYWDYNREALLNYLDFGLMGIKGMAVDSISREPLKARIFIKDYDKDSSWIYCDPADGWFFRLLNPGSYEFMCSYPAYTTQSKTVTVTEGEYSFLEFEMTLSGTGIEDSDNEPFSVYSCENKIELDYAVSAEINLFDLSGRMINSWNHLGGKVVFELGNIPEGIYLIRISDNEKRYSRKLLIR